MNKKLHPIPRTVHLPGWLLRLRGRVDAVLRGRSAAEAYIGRIYHREAALEADEVMAVETAMGALRENAAQRLAQRKRLRARLEDPLLSPQGSDTDKIRAGRRDAQERAAAESGLVDCHRDILSANEELIRIHALLDQRLTRLRAQTAESISFYVMGVRSSRSLKDFTYAEPEFPASLEQYLAHHKTLDNEIVQTATQMIEEVAAA